MSGLAARRPGEPRPAGRRVVPHARPWLGVDEEQAAIRVLRQARLAPGAEAARLEGLVARLAGAADAVAVGSGTLALSLALEGLGVRRDDHVAVPAYACAALLHAVFAVGARPLICDIEPDGLAIDPDDVRRRATSRLAALVLVHPFGWPVPIEPYRALGPAIIEDCAQSPGASFGRLPVGARGDAAIFSFGPTKPVTCGGPGGALAAPVARLVREARERVTHDEREDAHPRLNGLMGDLHAAIAVTQIGRLPEIVARRRAVAERYDRAFADLPIEKPRPPAGGRPVHHRYLFRLHERRAGRGAQGDLPRAAETIAVLQSAGVMARPPVFRPLHTLLPGAAPCPVADEAHARWISLPLSAAFTEPEVEYVVDQVRACLSRR
ncbi:MAG TPA: DegT/DnrJ/EryC1/StrS family aminotransferase [Patescibacteria group bacterium]|nr:DegT/DnrJ/EryC1/StrS family aminotransferase [Patescibacteria group bacterium]